MKAKIYLLLIALPLMVWGCSDRMTYTEKRSGELSKGYRDSELSLEFNGEQTTNKSVFFYTDDLHNAEVSFNYLIPGEQSVATTATMSDGTEAGSYNFTGGHTNADREITYTGTVGDRLTAQLTYRSLSQAVGKWQTVKVMGKHIQFDIEPSHEGATIDMKGFRGNHVVPLVSVGTEKSLQSEIAGLSNLLFMMVVSLEVDLQENGGLIASWTSTMPMIGNGQSQPGMVRFNTGGGKLFAAVAIDKLMEGGDLGSLEIPEIAPGDVMNIYNLLHKVYTGLPLPLQFPEEEKIEVRLTREMMLPYLDLVFGLLDGVVGDLDLGSIGNILGVNGEILSAFLPELKSAIVDSPKFDIVITLNKKK